jgi:hypothetical protein
MGNFTPRVLYIQEKNIITKADHILQSSSSIYCCALFYRTSSKALKSLGDLSAAHSPRHFIEHVSHVMQKAPPYTLYEDKQ